jgi:hypothetical protein
MLCPQGDNVVQMQTRRLVSFLVIRCGLTGSALGHTLWRGTFEMHYALTSLGSVMSMAIVK